MISKICIFGSNSILAKNFIKKFRKDYNLVGIQRHFLETNNFDNLIKIIKFNLGEKYPELGYKKLIDEFGRFREKPFRTFIIYSWAGKHNESNKKKCNDNFQINNNILDNLIYISKIVKPNQIIFISSAGSIYDPNSDDFFDELHSTKPSSAYGHQKLEVEEKIRSFCINRKINLTILRVSTAYGYEEKYTYNGVLNKWLMNAKKNKPIKIYNSLDSTINFISFNQISLAINFCIKKEIFGLYNIGSLKSTKLMTILDIVKSTCGKNKLKIIQSGDLIRNFNLNTDLFKLKTNLTFEDQLIIEAKKIYEKME